MSVVNLKSISENLVFYYDIGNLKSYAGEPSNNCFFTPTPDAAGNVGFAVNGNGTFVRVYSGTYGGYQIQPTDVVYRYDLGAYGCHYHGNDFSIPAGNYVTFSFEYFTNAFGYAETNYLANIENGGDGLGAAWGDPTPSIQGVWKSVSGAVGPSSGGGFSRFLLYPGACGGRLGSGGYILYKNPRAEYNKQWSTNFFPGNVSTVATRSATQGLLDISPNRSTIDLTNTTFNSSSTVTFNGTSSNMSFGSVAVLGNNPRSYFAWIKFSGGSYCILSTGTAANSQAFNLVTYGGYSKIGVMGYNNDFYPTTGANISDNNWHYVGATFDGVTLRTYVDGKLDNSGNFTYSTTGQNNYVGKSNHGGNENYFNGSINVVQFYNKVLTASEVLQNFNATKGRFGL